MANNTTGRKGKTIWRDRRHIMWFPLSFTIYELKNDRIYEQRGFFSTSYDELLLYRVVDLTLTQTLSQKLFGTGTLILKCRADSSSEVRLENIKDPMGVKELLSEQIESARRKNRVIGKEFYGDPYDIGGGHDMDEDDYGYDDSGDDMMDEDDQ